MNAQNVSQRRVTGKTVRTVQPKRKKHHYVRNTFLTLLFLGLVGVAGAFATFLIAYATTEIPKPSQFARAQVTTVYYNDGATPIGKFAEVNREIINTEDLPKYVGNAVVASEDRTFWTNSGVDIKGIVRAFINNLRGQSLQGASTLSQQYVERYYTGEVTNRGSILQRYWAKAQEAIMALKINRVQDKDEILGNYLNTIYFGRSSYGIEAASKAYFGKSAKDMTYSEAALIAGLIPAPSVYDPAVDPQMAQTRWKRVLRLMQADGYITQKQHDEAVFPQTITPEQNTTNFSGVNGYLMFQVRQELKEQGGLSEDQIDTMGLKITTTLDKDKQDMIMETANWMPASPEAGLRFSMLSTDPTTGEIIAEFPGFDYLKNQVNTATQSHFQAGSTFKPFCLIAGIEKGVSIYKTYDGNSPQTIQGQKITNYGGRSYGQVSLVKALANSLNTPFVKLNSEVGPDMTREVAIRLGYSEDTPGLDDTLTNTLGSSSPTAVDIATAYGTIINEGKRETVHIIRQVTDSTGDIVYIPSFRPEQAIERNVALNALTAMQAVFTQGSAIKDSIGRPVAGKTGTSSDDKSAVFIGGVPQMLTVVAMFQSGADGSEQSIVPWGGYGEIIGEAWPSELWKHYMLQATRDLPIEKFNAPQNLQHNDPIRSESPTPTETPTQTPSPSTPVQPSEPATPAPSPSDPSNGGTDPAPHPSTDPAPQPSNDPAPQPSTDTGGGGGVSPSTVAPAQPGT